jgi:hypothetical protein
VTDDVTQAFADHCVQKALNVDGIATVSPAQGVPPGTLAAAEDLLASASSDFSEAGGLVSFAPPTSTSDVHAESVGRIPPVKQIIAAYGLVTAHGPLPGAAAAGYADVAAWVLAWKTTPKGRHCYSGIISNVTPSPSPAPAPLGPLADWHFLVVPSDGHPPLVLEPRADQCSLRADAKVGRVFRREQPAISATGGLRAYNCGEDATTLEFASVTDVDGRPVLEAPVGVPVDMTGCVVKTENIGADWGAATPAPAGPLGGWPSWLPKP